MHRTATAGTRATAFVLCRLLGAAGLVVMTVVHDGVGSLCRDFDCRKGYSRDSAHQHGYRKPRTDECAPTSCPPNA